MSVGASHGQPREGCPESYPPSVNHLRGVKFPGHAPPPACRHPGPEAGLAEHDQDTNEESVGYERGCVHPQQTGSILCEERCAMVMMGLHPRR